MADQQDATSADVESPATEDNDAQAEELLADAVNSDTAEETKPDSTDDADDADGDDKPLGPAGEKALTAEKQKARLLRATLRQVRAQTAARDAEMADLRKQLEKLTPKEPAAKKASVPDAEAAEPVDVEELRREAREQVETELKAAQAAERVLDKIELKATRTFIDPADAVSRLMREKNTDDFLDETGKPDVEAIQDALEDLLQRAPHLAATAQGGSKRFSGSGDGGAKPTKQPRPGSVHEAVSRALNKT
ncbi:hypothetical protein [Streptosporangium sp. G12]